MTLVHVLLWRYEAAHRPNAAQHGDEYLLSALWSHLETPVQDRGPIVLGTAHTHKGCLCFKELRHGPLIRRCKLQTTTPRMHHSSHSGGWPLCR